jgi:hypothetical protein
VDRGGEQRHAAGSIGDSAAEWIICEPVVHLAPVGPEGRLAEADNPTAFVQAVIGCESVRHGLPPLQEHLKAAENSLSSSCASVVLGRIEIVLVCGRRVMVDNGVDSATLARVLAVLERR